MHIAWNGPDVPFCVYVHPATDGRDVYSMDDKAVYGETLHMSTSQAIREGIIKAFKVTAFNTCGCVSIDGRQF